MDSHVREFYTTYTESPLNGHFHNVIAVHETPILSWEDVSSLAPNLCKGWYELAHLPSADRIEFIRDYWLAKLPYHPHLLQGIQRFFARLDDIGLFLVQKGYEDPYMVHLVYSVGDDGGFFHGNLPATDQEIQLMQAAFPKWIFPPDYITFLQIHNGFSKVTDTGLCSSAQMAGNYSRFQAMLDEMQTVVTTRGVPINGRALIPFYESFGRPLFQCFYGDWYPDQEMGNVYFSAVTGTVSDFTCSDSSEEVLAFPTFIEWLMFYLESIDS